eukprot:2865899-Ditylum_brightwellii.AAC.1
MSGHPWTKPNPKTGKMKIDESGGLKGKPTENEKEGKTANNPVFIGDATGGKESTGSSVGKTAQEEKGKKRKIIPSPAKM